MEIIGVLLPKRRAGVVYYIVNMLSQRKEVLSKSRRNKNGSPADERDRIRKRGGKEEC